MYRCLFLGLIVDTAVVYVAVQDVASGVFFGRTAIGVRGVGRGVGMERPGIVRSVPVVGGIDVTVVVVGNDTWLLFPI